MRYAPHRITRITPDGERIAEWDRRRGIALAPGQRRVVGAGTRIAVNTVGTAPPLDAWIERDNGVHRVTCMPPLEGQPGLVRVDMGIRNVSDSGYLRVEYTLVPSEED